MKRIRSLLVLLVAIAFTGCEDDDTKTPTFEVPDTYSSSDFEANTVAESTVLSELSAMTTGANEAESAAPDAGVESIEYPSTLQSVTLQSYRALVADWLVELVASANDPDAFENPGLNGTPTEGEEGGLLGTRLLDENGLELEQMVQKGSFGAALYNHALEVINNGDLTDPGTIDKLVKIHGTDPAFDPGSTTAAATYSKRRSNQTTQTGTFYDIRTAVITARASIDAGSDFNTERDQALDAYLLAWEQSNFATVIYYCRATIDLLNEASQLEDGDVKDVVLGNAMHAYAEGVGFAHGFKGLSNKLITDDEIDGILELLLAPEGQTPESHRFLNDASLLSGLQTIIEDIQTIYGFTDAEITSFYVNDPE